MIQGGHVCLIRITSPEGVETSHTIDKETFTIGRSSEADVRVNLSAISRLHLKVQVTGRHLLLIDLGSANGTTVEQEPLRAHAAYAYQVGESVYLGRGGGKMTLELVQSSVAAAKISSVTMSIAQNPQKPRAVIPTHNARNIEPESEPDLPPVPSIETPEVAAPQTAPPRHVSLAIEMPKEPVPTEIIARANRQAEQIIIDAKNTVIAKQSEWANEAKAKAHEEGEKALESARDVATQMLTQAREESEKILSDARLSVSNVKLDAQTEASVIIDKAHSKASETLQKADATSDRILNESKKRVGDRLSEVEAKAESLLHEARATSAKIREEATREHERAKVDAKLKITQFMKQAESEAIDIAATAKHKAEAIQTDAVEKAAGILKEAAQKAELEREQLFKRADLEIARINSDKETFLKQRAAAELDYKEIEKGVTEMRGESAKITLETEQLKLEYQEAQRTKNFYEDEIKKIREEIEKARGEQAQIEKDMKLALNKTQDANQRLEEIKKQHESTEQDIQKQRSGVEREMAHQKALAEKELQDVRMTAAKEAKELREKARIDHEARLRQEEEEILKMRLTEVNEAKERKIADERQMKLAKRHHMNEIARQLEIFLIPPIHEAFNGQPLPPALQSQTQNLREIVTRVMTGDSVMPKAASELQTIIQYDHDVQSATRKLKIKQYSAAAVVVVFAVIYLLFPEALKSVKNHLSHFVFPVKTGSDLYVEKLAADRANQPKYNPQQTENYYQNYTDNVLYKKDYVSFKLNNEIKEKWILSLNRFFVEDLKLDENMIVSFVASEIELVDRLRALRERINPQYEAEGIEKMRSAEFASLTSIKSQLENESHYKRFREFEKSFIEKNSFLLSATSIDLSSEGAKK